MTPTQKLDPKGLNTIEIQVDMRNKPYSTRVGTNYSAWDSLFVILEGVVVLAKLAVKEGLSVEKVAKKIESQFASAFTDYEETWTEK